MGCTVEEANRRIAEAKRKYGKKEVGRLEEAFKAVGLTEKEAAMASRKPAKRQLLTEDGRDGNA